MNQYSFQPRRAVRQNLKARIGLLGPAGSGKTYTALAVATGLGERVCIIDTERGSSERYADLFTFDVVELPHFSPEMYAMAIEQLASSGNYDVLVVDSLSHAWAGPGGALEMVDEAAKKAKGNSYVAWRDVTPMHNRMVDAMLQAQCHVIVTMRTKTAYELVDVRGKKVPQKIGLAPIQRDGLEFEFDLVLDLDIDHNATVSKCRYATLDLSEGKPLDGALVHKPGQEFGRILSGWLNQGETAEERALRMARAEEKRRTRELQAQVERKAEQARSVRQRYVDAGVWPAWADETFERALDLAVAYADDERAGLLIRAMLAEARNAQTESRDVDPTAMLPRETLRAVADFGAEADDECGWPEIDPRVWIEIVAEHAAGMAYALAEAQDGPDDDVRAAHARGRKEGAERTRAAVAGMSLGDVSDLIERVTGLRARDRWEAIRQGIGGATSGDAPAREPGADDDVDLF